MSNAATSKNWLAPWLTLPRTPEQEFRFGLRWSFLLHFGIAFVMVLQTVVFRQKPKPYVPTLRVDLVGLPDVLKKDLGKIKPAPTPEKTLEELKEAETQAQKVEAPKAEAPSEPASDEMAIKNKKADPADDRQKKLKNALDRIKSLSKITEEEAAPAAARAVPITAPIKGNQISPGTSLSGDAQEATEASYFDVIRDKLQQNWALPVWLARQNLSAQVQVFIDARGMVRSLKIVKTSGNPQFDEAVKRAISDSQPFSPPPGDLKTSVLIDGILVGFPL